MLPLVTVQIPTYNQKQYIKEALDSALAQTYENLQIIISDDCSLNYDIVEYLSEYRNNPKVIIHRNNKNLGRVANYRNTLYNLVEGEWFINLDGDDYFTDNDFIKNAVSVLNEKHVLFAYNHDIEVYKPSFLQYTVLDINTIEIKGVEYYENLDKIYSFAHASCLFKTSVAKRINFYSVNALSSDYDSACRIVLEGYVVLSNKKVAQWRQHESNATWTLDENHFLKNLTTLKSIITAGKSKIPIKKLKIVENAIYRGFFMNTLPSIVENNNWKDTMFFVLKYSRFNQYFLVPVVKFFIKKK